MILVIGDVHHKKDKPYRKAIDDFFNWLEERYDLPNIIGIQTGDYLDTSRPHSEEVMDVAIRNAKRFKEFHIVGGNHEIDHRYGNPLVIFKHIPGIHVYLEKTEVTLGDKKFLFLPYYKPLRHMQDHYKNLEWVGDYCVAHFAFPGTNFGHQDEVALTGINAFCIYGHIHKHQIPTKDDLVLGVPQNTRYGEHEWGKKILEIDVSRKLIGVPDFLDYREVEYGQDIPEGNVIYNVVNAPSIKSIKEKYGSAHLNLLHSSVRTESTTRKSINLDQQKEKLNTDLMQRYKDYAEKELTDYSQDIHTYILSKL